MVVLLSMPWRIPKIWSHKQSSLFVWVRLITKLHPHAYAQPFWGVFPQKIKHLLITVSSNPWPALGRHIDHEAIWGRSLPHETLHLATGLELPMSWTRRPEQRHACGLQPGPERTEGRAVIRWPARGWCFLETRWSTMIKSSMGKLLIVNAA